METSTRSGASPLLRWSLVALWAGAIFAASSVPGSRIPGGYSAYGHLIEYLVLGALVAWAIDRSSRATLTCALVLCAIFAVSDELHQAYVPMRTPDPLDWVVDMVGATAGAVTLVWWLARGRAGSNPVDQ